MLLYVGLKGDEHFGCFMSFTFSCFMLHFTVLYSARPIKPIQLFQHPLLFWHGFSMHRIQLLTMQHQQYQPLLLVFVHYFCWWFSNSSIARSAIKTWFYFSGREIIRGIWLLLCWSILSCFTAFTYRLVNVKFLLSLLISLHNLLSISISVALSTVVSICSFT